MFATVIMETNEFKKYEPEEFRPGSHLNEKEEIVKACSHYAQTIFHPVGTCKMGNDESAVVSDKLKVYGLNKLRVIDKFTINELVTFVGKGMSYEADGGNHRAWVS